MISRHPSLEYSNSHPRAPHLRTTDFAYLVRGICSPESYNVQIEITLIHVEMESSNFSNSGMVWKRLKSHHSRNYRMFRLSNFIHSMKGSGLDRVERHSATTVLQNALISLCYL